MSHSNAPYGTPNPGTFPVQDVPTSVEEDSTVQYDFNSTFDFSSLFDGGTSHYDTTGFEPEGSSMSTLPPVAQWEVTTDIHHMPDQSTNVATGDIFANGAFGSLATIDAATLASAPAPPPLADYGANPHDLDPLSEFINWDLFALPTLSPLNTSSDPSPPKDGIGDQINPPHAHDALASNLVSTGSINARDIADHVFLKASLPDLPSVPSIHGNFQEERLALVPSYRDGVSSTPQTQRDDAPVLTPVGMSENMSHSFWLNHPDPNPNMPAPINLLMATTTTAAAITGGAGGAKAVLDEDEGDSVGCRLPQKRTRPASWVLEGADESRKRTRHLPAARAQQQNMKCIKYSMMRSGEARNITEQGLHLHLLRGANTTQKTVGPPEQEQFEGGAQLETQHNSSSTVLQQIDPQTSRSVEGQKNFYAIPIKLTRRQRLMLRTTEDEEERKAVRVIKCKLCPDVELNSWPCFRRHCNMSEDHPIKLTFCSRCGDHFARQDSKKRHEEKKYQEECHMTPSHEANRKKETIVQLLKDFNVELERRLSNGEEPGRRFPVIAQKNVPTTSKKEYKRSVSEGGMRVAGMDP
ncbi:hypothetical protein H4582DRAFT_1935452 [Lactarius indigo]|nr:hypothetical protein H4582DRAFT_1935452 [Lactarius indigo]